MVEPSMAGGRRCAGSVATGLPVFSSLLKRITSPHIVPLFSVPQACPSPACCCWGVILWFRGWGVHLAVVNSRRRNLITPFTITSQPPRGLDTRLGNCCRRKCSLKLTSPGSGTETRETTKAFRQMQDHSTYDVPLWGRNLVAYRVHTHKHTNKVCI